MDLLSGLEQFGIYAEQDDMEIYADEKRKAGSVKKQETKEEKKVLTEVDYLFTKKINCTICDREIYVRMVKGTKLKRMQPDFDLRPRFEGIDALKYDVFACPYCGYAAMGRYFDHLTRGQIQLVKDNVCANFRYASDDLPDVIKPGVGQVAKYAQAGKLVAMDDLLEEYLKKEFLNEKLFVLR